MTLDDATDESLAMFAHQAFIMGLRDGRKQAKPASAMQVAGRLMLGERRKLHTDKFRQVYGAGFDIGTMQKRLGESDT